MKPQIGDEVTIEDLVTHKVMECVVTKVVETTNTYNLLVRRKNNHPFRNGEHNKWVAMPKEEKA